MRTTIKETNTVTREISGTDESKDNSIEGMVASFQPIIKLLTEMSGTVKRMEKAFDIKTFQI